MRKKFTLLIALLAFMPGSSTVWGQLLTPNTVNNEFGAGESVKITAGDHILQRVTNPPIISYTGGSFTYGTFNNFLSNSPVSDIQIGSMNGENIVIRTYTGDGFAMGWISVLNRTPTPSESSSPTYPDPIYGNNVIAASYLTPTAFSKNASRPIYEFSFNKFNYGNYTAANWSANPPPCGLTVFEATLTPGGGGSSNIGVMHHSSGYLYTTAYPSARPSDFYISTIDATYTKIYPTGYYDDSNPTTLTFPSDDGIDLVQFNGLTMSSGLALHGQTPLQSDITVPDGDLHLGSNATKLANYKRPTTVILEAGNHLFDKINITDVKWQYQKNSVIATPSYIGNLSNCNTGASSAYAFTVSWTDNNSTAETLVDGAVRLSPDALVCVENNTSDATANPASIHTTGNSPDAKTDAIIVLPNAASGRFTLRTAGNFSRMNLVHDATSTDVYYTQAAFPSPHDNIYLYPSVTISSHPFASPLLNGFDGLSLNSGAIASIAQPSTAATSSVFGVYGDYIYATNNADIHTTAAGTPAAATGEDNNPGVIEIGPSTNGKTHFHVYSGGILKNFESCHINSNFAMNFGTSYGNTPNFYIDENEELSILNYGNNAENFCNADILFHAGSTGVIQSTFADATKNGAFRIQALSDVELREDVAIDATITTNTGNNLYLLSDGGNIVAQKLDIKNDYVNTVGSGLITFWAEDRDISGTPGFSCANTDANRNALRGNIYLNDAVLMTRTNNSADDTETNLVAANNLRTAMFNFNSDNTNNDVLNVISRKGDIYLGYSAGSQVYNSSDALVSNNATGNGNIFSYQGTGTSGTLNILSGYDDQANNTQYGGGNIYFTRINADMTAGNTHETNIMIPFSNEYYCGSGWVTGMLHERLTNNTMQLYEHAGIIGGVGRCGIDGAFGSYGGLLENPGPVAALAVTDTGLVYRANNGNLLVDAGLRGNIIINQGTYLDFQDDTADAFFLTRSGDIDMRGQTNIDHLQGSVLFLASSEESDKLKTGICGCTEQQNNVYLQDLEQRLLTTTKGSIFIGADNNIKLQYGGLKNIGTQIDPFLSENAGYDGVSCGTSYHCDSDTSENKARDLILNFAEQNGEGGMGIVASDLIDIYKNMIYTGGNGPGMGSVPTYGTLHGEGVAGYGLYIKSQGNKNNWTKTDFDVLGKCGRDCDLEDCKDAFLHQTARVTFHADARLYPENQRAYIGSPVLDVYGNLELNTTEKKGSKTAITIQTDSLICHDSLIIDGTLTKFDTWSSLYRNMPVIKLGHQRFTPPFTEDGTVCAPCYIHNPASGSIDKRTALDSIFVTFRNSANLPRLHTLVADHAVISFLTDSFDHVKGNPVINAKFYTDTFKVRNHVELFNTADHTHDGHFELISEAQMDSKDYAGIYARHLHMEPIQPGCTDELYSQLWLQDPALDVITTSTFGGFGTIHADVHIEIEAKLAPGYASLGKEGRCYEQKAGTLKMQDLRLDKGAEIYYSVGTEVGFDGEYTDCIEVDELMIYGSVNIFVEKRLCQDYVEGCYPIIRYKTVANGETNLNNLKLGTNRIDGVPLSLDASTPGVVYLCVGENAMPPIQREINIPSINGGTITPSPGTHYVNSQGHFYFSIKFDSEPPLKVTTGRTINGEEEEVVGKKNANGEYEYVIYDIREVINLTVGPDYATSNSSIDGSTVVWSHGNTIYIRVDKEDIASIYSIAGQLVKRIELSEGSTSVPMERGVYIVTLKDGSVHKVILK